MQSRRFPTFPTFPTFFAHRLTRALMCVYQQKTLGRLGRLGRVLFLQEKKPPNLLKRLGGGWEWLRKGAAVADLVQMRRLWPVVARRLADEGWSEAVLLEGRAALAEAVAAKDEPTLAAWLVWLEQQAARPMRMCVTCGAFRQPRGTDGFCVADRGGLQWAFSAAHPLKRLPSDGGVSCDVWRVV